MREDKIRNWDHFKQYIDAYDLHKITNTVLFRGQSYADWKLTPSLTRIVGTDNVSREKAIYYERQSELEFRSQYHNVNERFDFHTKSPSLAYYVDMQHYSFPTRLLDWSTSPYVALYFAVNNIAEDGSVYIWDSLRYINKMNSLYSNYETMTAYEMLNFDEYDSVNVILASKKNVRLQIQQGCFSVSNNLLANHCDLIANIFEKNEFSGVIKLIIPGELKIEFLARLKLMNITASSLFPGLEGIGRAVTEELLIRRWRKS